MEISTSKREELIYEVYKNGHKVNAPAEIQHLIRDLAEEHSYPERVIFGMIIKESTFNPKVSYGGCHGLAQITPYWLRAKPLEPYRLTDDYRGRDLFNPEHNLLTLIEMWNYARDKYDIDTSTVQGMKDLLYWHNTGKYIKNVTWKYSDDIFKFASELILIESSE